MFTDNPVDKYIHDFHLPYLRAAAREDGILEYEIDYCAAIARMRGWLPIDIGEKMTVRMAGRQYEIKRLE